MIRRVWFMMLVLLASCSTQTVEVLPTASPVAPTQPVPITLLQLKNMPQQSMQALLMGKLVAENGCLRVLPIQGGTASSVIWYPNITLDASQNPPALMQAGRQVARVGNTVRLGGGEIKTLDQLDLQQPTPEACVGPYWLVGEIVP